MNAKKMFDYQLRLLPKYSQSLMLSRLSSSKDILLQMQTDLSGQVDDQP